MTHNTHSLFIPQINTSVRASYFILPLHTHETAHNQEDMCRWMHKEENSRRRWSSCYLSIEWKYFLPCEVNKWSDKCQGGELKLSTMSLTILHTPSLINSIIYKNLKTHAKSWNSQLLCNPKKQQQIPPFIESLFDGIFFSLESPKAL